MEVGLKGLYPSLISYLLLIDSATVVVISLVVSLLVTPCVPMDSSNLMVTVMTLIKLSGSQNQTKIQESGQGTPKGERSLTRMGSGRGLCGVCNQSIYTYMQLSKNRIK